ncbi:polysaccharide deacetylase family protein [Kovacikia minuta CCNUW1]|uniref:polysaccharide deacetylase family protein n=1 Tax=Kovacikia minuta TaxID=2931930 RepID=UPI001CCDDA80|nr:polysaccharide deacetylase family protein [Kovacikia minuta]UBF26845.1 polysaccharide deacetylase family protein [Kovacikia minuta CCNUW1]
MPFQRKHPVRSSTAQRFSHRIRFLLFVSFITFLPVASVSLALRVFMPEAIAQLGRPPEGLPGEEFLEEAPVQEQPLEQLPTQPVQEAPRVSPPATCQPVRASSTAGLTRLVSDLSQTATLVEQPAIGMGALVEQMGPQLMAYLNAAPFPEINAKARAARVPVMMYHDIRPDKQVFFDVTPEEFEHHLKLIQQKGLTPITMDQLVIHLRTGLPLPEKPILLTFDDGYEGHYTYAYPLLKKYGYPAVFSIYTDKIEKQLGRKPVTWEQLKEMVADPLVTIASHSVTHRVMTTLSEPEIQTEVQKSKQILEAKLGIPIHYFTYPEGNYNAQIAKSVQDAGYAAALTMNDADERLAGQSESLMAIGRLGQSRLESILDTAWGGPRLQAWNPGFDFSASVQKVETTIDNTPFILISGGRPITIHADSRYQVPEILAKSGTGAIAAVDGAFFSLEFLDSNEMLGPILSQSEGRFVPGKKGEIPLINNRPLVLIGASGVKFVPFNNLKHNTLEGIQAELPDVTDAFVAAGWLVENGQAQPPSRFGKLFDFDAPRHRAFWGINQQGQPVVGVSTEPIGSVDLGKALAKAGLRDAVMLDSGASTSLAYKGTSLVGYTPRPVPHVVALLPPEGELSASCAVVSLKPGE